MDTFKFNISLSILNHLGRNLYRSIITVLGEAISNSWDAGANNVYITIDKDQNRIIIQDDGEGMSSHDFQDKFLKIGYSKRKDNTININVNRPFIGRKGIGKLALLSCARTVSIITKKESSPLVSGVIDNTGLNEAIKDDVSTDDYILETVPQETLDVYGSLDKGTVLIFDDITDGVRNRIDYIRQLLALYFRFSIIDSSFHIHLNGEEIGINELQDLSNDTQFLWRINDLNDAYVSEQLEQNDNLKKKKTITSVADGIKGFIASVNKPSELKIRGTEEKISVDLFVNGRLREKDILRHIPSTRIVENYLYGQIHYDALDDETDRFTSSREGVVSDDPKFIAFLKEIELAMRTIIEDWDKWRVELNQEGDSENTRITKKERKSRELVSVVATELVPTKDYPDSRKKVETWVNELNDDAQFNVSSYTECFLSENLLRNYLREKKIPIPSKMQKQISDWKTNHLSLKNKANIFFEVRENPDDLSYCDMGFLANLAADPADKTQNVSFIRDAKEYSPIRDALCHTSRLTQAAKNKLNTTYENIKSRIIQLLNKS